MTAKDHLPWSLVWLLTFVFGIGIAWLIERPHPRVAVIPDAGQPSFSIWDAGFISTEYMLKNDEVTAFVAGFGCVATEREVAMCDPVGGQVRAPLPPTNRSDMPDFRRPVKLHGYRCRPQADAGDWECWRCFGPECR